MSNIMCNFAIETVEAFTVYIFRIYSPTAESLIKKPVEPKRYNPMTTERKPQKKSKRSKKKFYIVFFVVMMLFAGIRHLFNIDIPRSEPREIAQLVSVPDEPKESSATVAEVSYPEHDEDADSYLYEEEEKEEPDSSAIIADSLTAITYMDNDSANRNQQSGERGKSRIYGVWSFSECFPDSNALQLQAAQSNGVTPAKTRADVATFIKSHRLVNINSSPFYYVDDLSHSMPYLVPKAQQLLNTIAVNFVDSLASKRMRPHIIMVTSVLRTQEDVNRLQRGNKNATTNSCHCYGTTMDIAYNRFIPVDEPYNGHLPELTRWSWELKSVLAEVLNDLRKRDKCYVKYERRQGCFHLTVR